MLALKVIKTLPQSCLTLCDPRDCSQPAPLSMEFSRQEYLSALPFPPPGDLPDPGTELGFPALQADSLPSEPPGKLNYLYLYTLRCFLVLN